MKRQDSLLFLLLLLHLYQLQQHLRRHAAVSQQDANSSGSHAFHKSRVRLLQLLRHRAAVEFQLPQLRQLLKSEKLRFICQRVQRKF